MLKTGDSAMKHAISRRVIRFLFLIIAIFARNIIN